MKEIQQVALQKLGEIIELGADKTVVTALTETVKNIDDMIKSLGSAARERLDVAALHDKQYDALRKAQADFVAASAPAMMDAQSQINAILGSANLSTDDATAGGADRRAARQRHRQRQSDGLRHDGGAVGQQQRHAGGDREGIQGRRRRASNRTSSCCPRMPATKALSEAALKLLALGEGKTGVFKIRQKELDAADYGQTILEETRKLNVGLGISVQQLVDGVQQGDRRLDLAGARGDFVRDHW